MEGRWGGCGVIRTGHTTRGEDGSGGVACEMGSLGPVWREWCFACIGRVGVVARMGRKTTGLEDLTLGVC